MIVVFGLLFIGCDMGNTPSTTPAQKPGDTPDNPITRIENRQLTPAAWVALLSEIEAEGKYVALDLSTCTPGNHNSGGGLWSDGTFNADPLLGITDGKEKIVSLILPEAAKSIADSPITGEGMAGHIYAQTFLKFKFLKNVTGVNIITIGGYAFSSLGTIYNSKIGSLTSINFPQATTIGKHTFDSCYSLTSANIPKIKTIGDDAFIYTKLQSLYIPEVTYIGIQAFGWCDNLSLLTLGVTAPHVDRYMFAYRFEPRIITVIVPHGATGYGNIPSDYIGGDTTKNWGNAFRGMGWVPSKANTATSGEGFKYDREGYGPADYIEPTITLRIEYIP